jgi:lipopolysaccharide assembly outer membrane protein LptD (OstA)
MVSAPPALAQPPLHISAANMTGSHGPQGDEVLLNGDVRIERGLTVITADNGRYLKAQGMLFLDGRVTLVDTTTTLHCDHAQYSEDHDLLEVSGNVVITDRGATLKAPFGTYDRARGRADLTGGVQAQDSTQVMTCQSLTYDRDSLQVHARGDVRGEAKKDKMVLRARQVDYDRRSHDAVATGDPSLETRDEKDRASTIRAIRLKLNTETRMAEAIDSVHIQRDTLQATGRYALFDDAAERGWLYGQPRAWDNETNVTGDTLEVWTEKRALRRFIVRHAAAMDYRGARANTTGEASRLTGDRIEVFFTDEEIDSLKALGEARNEYRGVPQAGKTGESNVAEGDTITVHFRARKIDRAIVRGKARGEYRLAVDVGDTTAARNELVRYDALRIEYQVPKNRIMLDSQARLFYRELQLQARRVEFDSEKQTLVASGSPELVDRGDKVTGHLMTYDLESRQGTIYQAETEYERGLYHGERIRKVAEDELDVKSGSYSTCSLDEPHYHFQAKYMKIFLKDKLIAKPVVFYVKNVPLLALPFWVFPIKPGRHSGFLFPQFEFGLSNRAGQFVRNAGYYWAPNDYMDITAAGDYYQAEPSWVLRGEGNYRLLYTLDGYFAGTFARSERDNIDRYDFNALHNQDLSPRTHLSARASFVSSRDYRRSNLFGSPLSQRLDRFLTSSLAMTHNADWASFSMALDRRQDLDADEDIKDPDGEGPLQGKPPGTVATLANLNESRPSLSVQFPTRSLGSIGWLHGNLLGRSLSTLYATMSAQLLSQRERTGVVQGYRYFARDSVTLDSTTFIGQRQTDRWGVETLGALRDSRRLLGWINFAPSFSTNAALFDHDNLGADVVPAATWRASFSTSTTFYGTSRLRFGRVEGIRHVVFPSVSFDYSPEFPQLTFVDSLGIRRERFTGFGGIGISGFKSSRMQLGLGQRWQVKVRKGDKVERLDNLLSWDINGSYNFLYREERQEHPLSGLSSTMHLQPPGALSADLNWLTDVYSERPVRSLSSSISVHLAGARGSTTAPATPGGSGRSAFGGTPPELPLDRRSQEPTLDLNEPWSLGLAFSYGGGYTIGPDWSSTQTVNGVAHFNLTPSWRMEYSTTVDVNQHQLLTQRFGLTRDLHCWQASFTRVFTIGGEAEYYFRLGVKDQREIYIERGTRIGSLGGIQ